MQHTIYSTHRPNTLPHDTSSFRAIKLAVGKINMGLVNKFHATLTLNNKIIMDR